MKSRNLLNYRKILYSLTKNSRLNAHETTVAAMLADKAAAGTLTPEDARRLVQAAARLGKAQVLANGD